MTTIEQSTPKPFGVSHSTSESLLQVQPREVAFPKVAVGVESWAPKLLPVMVTHVPPSVGPSDGLMLVITGAIIRWWKV